MAKTNRFGALSSALKGEAFPEQVEDLPQLTPTLEATPTDLPVLPKRTRAQGKRSNPDFEQVGAYLPKQLIRKVKQLLLEQDDKDFSELVAQVLQEWVDQHSSN